MCLKTNNIKTQTSRETIYNNYTLQKTALSMPSNTNNQPTKQPPPPTPPLLHFPPIYTKIWLCQTVDIRRLFTLETLKQLKMYTSLISNFRIAFGSITLNCQLTRSIYNYMKMLPVIQICRHPDTNYIQWFVV